MGLPKVTRSWRWSCQDWDWCLYTKRQERAFFQPLSPPYEDITKKSFLPRNQISQLFDLWTSQPAQLWEINFCCASHPVCGILLYQTKLTETAGSGKSVPRPAEGLSAMAHLTTVCGVGGEGGKCSLAPLSFASEQSLRDEVRPKSAVENKYILFKELGSFFFFHAFIDIRHQTWWREGAISLTAGKQ